MFKIKRGEGNKLIFQRLLEEENKIPSKENDIEEEEKESEEENWLEKEDKEEDVVLGLEKGKEKKEEKENEKVLLEEKEKKVEELKNLFFTEITIAFHYFSTKRKILFLSIC
jgi:hypothetical protein